MRNFFFRIIAVFFFIIQFSAVIAAQIPVPIDSIFSFIRLHNIHTKGADWDRIGKGFEQQLQSAKTDKDSIRSLVYVFEQLNDYHSSIIYNGNSFSNNPVFDDSTLKYLMPLVNLSNQRTGVFTAKQLPDNYLYLQVPGVNAFGEQVSMYTRMLADTFAKHLNATTKGIVLDLRLNGGGQFSSMAAGIAPLLGDGFIGGGVNSEGDETMRFELRNGNLFMNNYQMTFINHKPTMDLTHLPVAVLIGPNTRSSGSILAITFKSRPNTVFIGDNTASGYTTSNNFFSYGNNLFLNLSTAFSTDRNHKVYKDLVEPDITVRGEDDFSAIGNDKKVQEALRWLSHKDKGN